MQTSTALTAFSFAALRLLSFFEESPDVIDQAEYKYCKSNTPSTSFGHGVKNSQLCQFVSKLLVGVCSRLAMGGRRHDGILTHLSKLDLQQHYDNPEESPIKAFTVNDKSNLALLCTVLVQSLYSSHVSNTVFWSLHWFRDSNRIAYFHEHKVNGLSFQKFSQFLPFNIVFCFVVRGWWHCVDCLC